MLAVSICFRTVVAQDQTIVLQNDQAKLVFETGRGGLTALEDKIVGHNHRDANPPGPLWQLVLDDGRTLGPAQAGNMSWCWPETEQLIELRWTGFAEAAAPDLSVTAHVRLQPHEPVSQWRISVSGIGGLTPRSLHFPRITGIAKQDREILAVPIWMGEQTRQARQWLNPAGAAAVRNEWSYPGLLSLQCLAHVSGARPRTDAVHGRHGCAAQTIRRVWRWSRWIGLRGRARAGRSKRVRRVRASLCRASTSLSWRLVLRSCLLSDVGQATAVGRAEPRAAGTVAGLGERYGAVGLESWPLSRRPRPVLALQEAAGVPVSVFWHWWHGCPYDAGFPEYLPPREGTAALRQAVANAQRHNVHSIVYVNQRLWGMTTRSWQEEGAEKFAVKNADGTITPEVYNTFMKVPCASMCMGTDFWRTKYASVATQAVCDLGVDGIYMDQACSSLACYDPAHGHPLGGGAWWMKGFQTLENDIRQRCAAASKWRWPVRAAAKRGCPIWI